MTSSCSARLVFPINQFLSSSLVLLRFFVVRFVTIKILFYNNGDEIDLFAVWRIPLVLSEDDLVLMMLRVLLVACFDCSGGFCSFALGALLSVLLSVVALSAVVRLASGLFKKSVQRLFSV